MTEPTPRTVNAAPILAECCARSLACRLHLLHGGDVVEATFLDVRVGRVVLGVTHADHDDILQPQLLCCVAFPFQLSLCAFVESILDVRNGTSALEVHVASPDVLTTANLRQSFRVPIIRNCGLQVRMQLADGTPIEGEVLNVSESGIEVNLAVDDVRLPVDALVQFDLRFREDRIELPAVVRHRAQSRRGLRFVPTRRHDERQQVAALHRVVRSLEQIWLKNRLA